MKKTLVVLVILVLGFFFVTALRGEEKVATSGGRWQLLQVSYNGKDGNRSGEIIAVLKIDTETGKTYRLLSKMDNGIPTEDRFIEIEDCPVPPKEKK